MPEILKGQYNKKRQAVKLALFVLFLWNLYSYFAFSETLIRAIALIKDASAL